MRTAALAAVLGIAAIAATGCDREPTSATAYNNSGASAAGTSANTPAPAAPNIQPATGDLAIPATVSSEPAPDAGAVPPAPKATAPASTATAIPDTASPSAPPSGVPVAPAADPAKPAEQPAAPR